MKEMKKMMKMRLYTEMISNKIPFIEFDDPETIEERDHSHDLILEYG